MTSQRRVVITGADVVSCCGNGLETFFDGLLAPAPTERPRQVPDYDLSPYFDKKEARRTDRHGHFAITAAAEALKQAGDLEGHDPLRVGTLIGTGIGGMRTFEQQVLVQAEKGAVSYTHLTLPTKA